MAILKIARMGHPVLRRRAEPVSDPTGPNIARLAADMIDTMLDAPGVGLAAPQVHVSLRLIVFHVPAARAGDPEAEEGAPDGPMPLTVLINPEIEVLDHEAETAWEACLSLPGLTGPVARPRRIRYVGFTPTGSRLERIAAGFHARVVQHECDHLDGMLYPQRMTDVSRLGFVDEVTRHILTEPDVRAAQTPSGQA